MFLIILLVERLDAPIERIEIRLIDDKESDNNTVYNDGFPIVTASEVNSSMIYLKTSTSDSKI